MEHNKTSTPAALLQSSSGAWALVFQHSGNVNAMNATMVKPDQYISNQAAHWTIWTFGTTREADKFETGI